MNTWLTIAMIGAIVLIFFLMYRSQKKQERQTNEMRNSLEVGDEVTTIGGIIGEIVSIKEETITIETGKDRTKIRVLRSAIRNVDVYAAEKKGTPKKAAEKEESAKKADETEVATTEKAEKSAPASNKRKKKSTQQKADNQAAKEETVNTENPEAEVVDATAIETVDAEAVSDNASEKIILNGEEIEK